MIIRVKLSVFHGESDGYLSGGVRGRLDGLANRHGICIAGVRSTTHI